MYLCIFIFPCVFFITADQKTKAKLHQLERAGFPVFHVVFYILYQTQNVTRPSTCLWTSDFGDTSEVWLHFSLIFLHDGVTAF